MRNLQLVLLFCYGVFGSASTQEYIPSLGASNEWSITSCFGDCITDRFHTSGDSTANGYVYKVLDGFHFISRTLLVREEIESGKIFLLKRTPLGAREYLLYDYSLSEGDSMELFNPLGPEMEEPGVFKLDSIRPFVLNTGLSTRIFYWSPTVSALDMSIFPVWVEGVGSLALFTNAGGTPNFDGFGAVSCAFKDGVLQYENLSRVEACEFTSNLSTINTNQLLFQNPVATILEVNLENFESYSIMDVLGNDITSNVERLPNGIDCSMLSSGFYYFKVNLFTGKILSKIFIKF